MAKTNHCVECRWCALVEKLTGVSKFFCKEDGKELPSDVVSRPACDRFQNPPPAGHWGP